MKRICAVSRAVLAKAAGAARRTSGNIPAATPPAAARVARVRKERREIDVLRLGTDISVLLVLWVAVEQQHALVPTLHTGSMIVLHWSCLPVASSSLLSCGVSSTPTISDASTTDGAILMQNQESIPPHRRGNCIIARLSA